MKGKKIVCGLLSGILALSVCAMSACGSKSEKDYAFVAEDLSDKNGAELENLADYSVFYKPDDGSRVGDTMPYYEDGVYHIFYLKDGGGVSSHPVYRVDTTDFVHYEEKGLVLPAGDSNGGEAMIGTGSIVKHGSEYLFFYTGHPAAGAETVRVAVSQGNLDNFVKRTDFEISPSDYGFSNDFRDPEVRWDETDECYYCIVSTRKGDCAVLAQFTLSETLEVKGEPKILYTDTRGFNVLECPTYFEWNGMYYITYSAQDLNLGDTDEMSNSSYVLTGSKGCVYYLCSENPSEGWREPANPQLDSKVFYAGKVAFGSDAMLVGWAAQRDVNATYKYAWGGNLVAHTLLQDQSGVLSLAYPKSYANHFDVKQPLSIENDSLLLVSSSGMFNPIASERLEYRLSMNVNFSSDASEFGLVFGLKDNMFDAVKVTINPLAGKIKAQYGQNSEMASNFLALEADTDYRIDVFAEGSNFVLYIEGVAFTFKVRNVGNRRIALFAQDGIVEFKDIAMFAPSQSDLDFTGSFDLKNGESRDFSVTPQNGCYVSANAVFKTTGETEISIISNGKTVASSSGKDVVSLFGYANVKAGKAFTVRVSAKENATVSGTIDGAQTHYVPVKGVQSRAKSENKGSSVIAKNDGYSSFDAFVNLNDKTVAGTLLVQKNGETVSSVEVKDGVARLSGAVETDSGDTLTAFVDFNSEMSAYSLYLQSGAAENESNLLPLGVNERVFANPFDVEVVPSNQPYVTAQGSFGEQGTNGFVYTYGKSIDEMQPCSNFNGNAVEDWEIQYTEPTVGDDLIVRSDWIKTGGHYSAGVSYIATKAGTLEVSLGVKPTEASGGYVLVQLYHNRNRIFECLRGSDWDWWNGSVRLSVKAGDCISFGIRNAGYLSDDGVAAANYSFAVQTRSDSGNSFEGMNKVADYNADFSSSNAAGNWKYGYINNFFAHEGEGKLYFEACDTFDQNEAWVKEGISGIEIKRDWICAENYDVYDVALGYTFTETGSYALEVKFVGEHAEETRLSARIILTDAEGNVKSAKFIDAGKFSKDWEHAEFSYNVEAGDTVYLIFFREGAGYHKGHVTFNVYE
ncbi:MAG: family 43 glycosylhydrolase [Clostridia bacterium]|nr:family 43 glycosylhydrolase [Clostridia bacterium]